jgi:hypothetical protein
MLQLRLGCGCNFKRWVEGQQLTTEMQTCLKHQYLLPKFNEAKAVSSDVARGYPFFDRLRLSWFVTEFPDLPCFMYTPTMVLMRRFIIPGLVWLFKWTVVLGVAVFGILFLYGFMMVIFNR